MSFPITLAFVPQGHFTQPYLALPCLKAWLQEAGFEDVEQRDLSIEAYDHFLSPDYLRRAQERVRERLPLSASWRAASLPQRGRERGQRERRDRGRRERQSRPAKRGIL